MFPLPRTRASRGGGAIRQWYGGLTSVQQKAAAVLISICLATVPLYVLGFIVLQRSSGGSGVRATPDFPSTLAPRPSTIPSPTGTSPPTPSPSATLTLTADPTETTESTATPSPEPTPSPPPSATAGLPPSTPPSSPTTSQFALPSVGPPPVPSTTAIPTRLSPTLVTPGRTATATRGFGTPLRSPTVTSRVGSRS